MLPLNESKNVKHVFILVSLIFLFFFWCINRNKKICHKIWKNVNIINKYQEIYKYHKKNPKDKQFAEEYYSELSVYKIAAKEILEYYKKLPNTKEILSNLDKLQEKKNTLMHEYSLNNEQFSDLVQYRKSYKKHYGNEIERQNTISK